MASVTAHELGVEMGVSSLEASSDTVLLCVFAVVAPVVLFCLPVLRICTTSSTREQMSTHQRLYGYPLQIFHQLININYSDYFIDPSSLRFRLVSDADIEV